MKKIAITLFYVALFQCVSAQYCGSSDTLPCITTNVPDSNGLYPPVDSFPPFYNNFLTSATIYFRNYDTILFGTEVLPVYSLTWDTIENLPPGLCWSTNKTNNTFAPGEAGCIHISGLACGPTGQYKLLTLVTVDIGVPVESDGDPGGLGYMVRLQNYGGDTIAPIDTSQTDSMLFIPYGGQCENLTPLVINLGPDETVCAGSIITFNPVVSGGQPPYTYAWQSLGSSIICTNCANASVTLTENSTYILEVMDQSGEYGFDTIKCTVAGTAYNFQITAPGPSAFCGGGTVILTAIANDSLSYQWYKGTGALTDSTGNTLIITDSTGDYYLYYTETNGCNATSNIINLVFYDTTGATIASQNSDTICVGASVALVASASGLDLNYVWLVGDTSAGDSGATIEAAEAGLYQVVVTNAIGCSDTSAGVLVAASPNLPPTLIYDQFLDDTMCNNAGAITLTGAEPAGGYYSGGGVSNGVFSPSAASAGLNLIYYNYTDSTGCANSIADSIDIQICTSIQTVNSTTDVINLFPDPAVDRLTIQSAIFQQGNATVSLYDLTGKRLPISYQRTGSDNVLVNISVLSPGCYLVRLTINGRQLSKRFMKME